MKLELTILGKKTLDEVLKRHEDSLYASEFYNAFLNENYADLSPMDIQGIAKENGCSLSQAYFSSLLLDLGLTVDDLSTALKNNHLEEVRALDPSIYKENPYFKKVKPLKFEYAGYSLETNSFLPYEGFIYRDVIAKKEDFYSEIYGLGFFKEEFPYLQLVKDGKIWMSITPYEIETMRQPIQAAKGKVLTFGLGLGYFAFRCLLKEGVTEVTVVEKDQAVIELFKKELLPFFPNKDKLKIVNTDAYDFIKEGKTKEFDYLFIDLYHDEQDGIDFYLKMSKMLDEGLKTSFWIEGSLIVYCRRVLLGLLEEALDGAKEEDYKNPKSRDDKLYCGFYELTKDVVLQDEADVLNFLSDESIRELVKRFSLDL